MSRAAVDREHLQRRPRLHRRVDVVERPLVGGEGAVRVLEPLAAEQRQLVLRERRVDVGECDAVERHVPRREPRVLPRVGHRHDVERLEVEPAPVAAVAAGGRRPRLGRIAVEPALDVVVVELLAPEHPRERLPHHARLVVGAGRRRQLRVELVRLAPPVGHDAAEVHPGRGGRAAGRSRRRSSTVSPAGTVRRVVEGGLRAAALGVDGGGTADDVIVDPVLRVPGGAADPEQPLGVRLVVAEEQRRRRRRQARRRRRARARRGTDAR